MVHDSGEQRFDITYVPSRGHVKIGVVYKAGGFCQFSRQWGRRKLVHWWGADYAAAMMPINWVNRS